MKLTHSQFFSDLVSFLDCSLMDFPPEIIKSILTHLELEDLKKCLLVSKSIRELIIKTPEIMRKFDVILFHETWKEKMPFIKKYGYFIRSIKCVDVGFDDENQFKAILKYTPNLERLSFTDCYIVVNDEPERNGDDVEMANNDNNAQAPENGDANHMPEQNLENNNDAEQMVIAENVLNIAQPNNDENDESVRNEGEQNNAEEAIANVDNNQPVENVPENNEIQNMEVEENNNEGPLGVKLENTFNEPVEPEINLHLLTYLHLESTTFAESLVKYIQSCNKLKYFKLTYYYQEPKTEFTEFVCQQDGLKELILQGYSDMVFKSLFHVDINEKAKFKLRTLSLECELSYHRNFSNFFRAQGEHIKELIISCYNIDFHYYRVLFNNFNKLEILVLPMDWTLNDSRSIAIKNSRLESVKELELVGSNDDLESFKTFINIFPNVEELKCENLTNFSLQGVLEHFQRLTSIDVDNFRCDTMLFVKLPSLKHLNVEFLSPTGHNFFWEKFTQDCPNIESLHIDEIGNVKLNASIQLEFRIIIQNLRNLKKLKTCRIACSPHDNTLNPDEDANVNERIHDDNPFYKVEINIGTRTITLSNHFARNCSEEVELLRQIFKECDTVEF